ncbi:hypothetical protein GCM10023086_21470 [Streptomyces venetus]|uniref:Peptidase C14 caspase domain-containing protein n=1 Tax=Streptomyces venetus TaxID=1701086 RepID=A0ABP8FI40_9ACTN
MPEPSGDLAGPDCHAVVVGTGRQRAGDTKLLADLPSAADSARAIARALRENCGMDGRVTEVINPDSATDVLTAVRAAIDRSDGGAVLFYFVGHGLLGPRQQLYLATASTASADDTVTAVPYAEIRNLLSDAPARTVVILDCCFSGRAAVPSDAHSGPYSSARPDGSFLLASATHYAASFAPVGDDHTLFSGELLRLLRKGDPGGPKWFTLIDLYRILDRRFQSGTARPHADGFGRAGDLVVAPNLAYPAPAQEEEEEERDREAPADGPCPYPGMRPFLPEQRHLYFGREKLTRNLTDRVTGDADRGPVVLVGASGAGKSSLLRAGLVAGLEDGGSGRVLLVPGPGARPFRTLVEHWSRAVGKSFAEVDRELGHGRFPGEGPGYLVVDQLEEIFTDCQDAEERDLFVRAVCGGDPQAAPRIVLSLRADFYGQCLGDARLARIVRAGQFTVPAMSDDELRRAIEEPARHAGLRLEDGLADHLLRDLRREAFGEGDAVALPFMAHALQQTWARRRGTLLTFAGYETSGGIRRSVARVADEVHDALGAPDRARLRELLLHMVTLVDADGRAVRRRIPAQAPDGAEDLLDRLVEARLVVVDQGEAQLCHDSLLDGWPRLRAWIRDDRVELLVRRRVGEAADSWHEAGRQNSGLYSGDQLATARSLLNAGEPHPMSGSSLRPVERDFLLASSRAERRTRKLRTIIVAVVAVLAVLAGTLAVVAREAQRDAEARETTLIANQLAAQADILREHDPQAALQVSLAAYRTAETSETRSSLYASSLTPAQVDLRGDSRQPVVQVAFSADGKVLATSQRKGHVRLWDVSRVNVPRKASAIDLDGAAPIAFHPRSRLFAALSNSALTLWDLADPGKPKRLVEQSLPETQSFTLAFSPDGRTLAAGSEEGRLRLWDVAEPSRPLLVSDRAVARPDIMSVSFSHDGRLLATGNGVRGKRPAEVRLWDVRDPAKPVLRATATAKTVMAVAFHPGRDLVVATGGKNQMVWWRVERSRRLVRIAPEDPFENAWGYGDGLPSLAFRPDGTRLAAADNSEAYRGARIRDVPESDDRELLASTNERDIAPSGERAQSVAYNPAGTHLAVGDAAGNVRLWPEQAPALALRGRVSGGDPGTRPMSDDGRLVLTQEIAPGPWGTVAHVWDLGSADTERGTRPRLRFTVPRQWQARYFLPGRHKPMVLAYRAEDAEEHTLRVWDFGGDGPPVARGEISVTASDIRTAVSPDGKLLVIGSYKGAKAEIWDLRDVSRPVRRAVINVTPAGSRSFLFLGPRALAAPETDEFGGYTDLRLWDVTDPAQPYTVRYKLKGVASRNALYMPSIRMFVADDPGQGATVWDLTNIRKPRKTGELPAASGGYTPVGEGLLATTLTDGTVQIRSLKDPKYPLVHTMRFDRQITSIELAPDGKRVVTGTPYRIWEVAPDGSWRTPAVATLEGVRAIHHLPGNSRFVLVQPKPGAEAPSSPDHTYLLDRDTDKVYDRLCRTNPLSLGKKQWKALFPHLAHRPSCG